MFPILDTKLRWMFPKRVQLRKDLDAFLSKIEDIVNEKRATIAKEGGVSSIDNADKDLCTLMIEAESNEGGKLTNEEMMVSSYCYIYMACF